MTTWPPMRRLLWPALLLASLPVGAATLDMPGNAVIGREERLPPGSYTVPDGPFAEGVVPALIADGEGVRQAWQIPATGLTSAQILTPLRQQLLDDGFSVIFACATEACGGFDFRFGIDVMQPPEMFVDLGDFRYLAMRREDEAGSEYVSLLVSRTALAGFLQVTRIGPALAAEVPLSTATQPPVRAAGTPPPGDFATGIEADGRFILSDLTFEIGSAQLGPGPFASLQSLADYLLANPTRAVALVGHTDSQGALDANIALSKRRAGSVLERLVSDYGIPRSQLAAEGMGFLSPLASNLTPEGRDLNRRVEVIITSTE